MTVGPNDKDPFSSLCQTISRPIPPVAAAVTATALLPNDKDPFSSLCQIVVRPIPLVAAVVVVVLGIAATPKQPYHRVVCSQTPAESATLKLFANNITPVSIENEINRTDNDTLLSRMITIMIIKVYLLLPALVRSQLRVWASRISISTFFSIRSCSYQSLCHLGSRYKSMVQQRSFLIILMIIMPTVARKVKLK